MAHPLDGARLKVVRAQEHLDTLYSEAGRYLGTNPYHVPVQINSNSVLARQNRATITSEPPLRLSCLLGDCVGNLRASLDYIAWELATRYATPPPVIGKDRSIFFPILDAPTGDGADRFAKMAAKYSFPASAVALIESVQPYRRLNPYWPEYAPLDLLNRLVNMDKHCLPLFTVAYIDDVWLREFKDGRYIRRSVGRRYRFNTANPGLPGGEPGSVNMEAHASVLVSLQDPAMPREPIDVTLENILKTVADIIPLFEPFF
jgi:hypothetical protein